MGAVALVGVVGEAEPVFGTEVDGGVEEDRLARGDVPVFPCHAIVVAAAEVERPGRLATLRGFLPGDHHGAVLARRYPGVPLGVRALQRADCDRLGPVGAPVVRDPYLDSAAAAVVCLLYDVDVWSIGLGSDVRPAAFDDPSLIEDYLIADGRTAVVPVAADAAGAVRKGNARHRNTVIAEVMHDAVAMRGNPWSVVGGSRLQPLAVGVRVAAVVPDVQPVVLERRVDKVYSSVGIDADVALVTGILRAEIGRPPVVRWPPRFAAILRDEEPRGIVVPGGLRAARPREAADERPRSGCPSLAAARPTIGAGPAQVLVCSVVEVALLVDGDARLVADSKLRIELAVVLVNALRRAWQPDRLAPREVVAAGAPWAARQWLRFTLVRRDPVAASGEQ